MCGESSDCPMLRSGCWAACSFGFMPWLAYRSAGSLMFGAARSCWPSGSSYGLQLTAASGLAASFSFPSVHAARCGRWRGSLRAGGDELDRRSVPGETPRAYSVTFHAGRADRWGAGVSLLCGPIAQAWGWRTSAGQCGGTRHPLVPLLLPCAGAACGASEDASAGEGRASMLDVLEASRL